MRIARSRTSGENFEDFLIVAPCSIEGASTNTGTAQADGPDQDLGMVVHPVVSIFGGCDDSGAGALPE
jgi:hypothetical protein